MGRESQEGHTHTRECLVQVGDQGTGTYSGMELPDTGLSSRLGRTEGTVGTLCRKVRSQAQRLWGDTSQDAGVPWGGAWLGGGSRRGFS